MFNEDKETIIATATELYSDSNFIKFNEQHSCAAIEHLGYPVAYMQPSCEGYITPKILKKYITDNTRLVSVMFANNEIGNIQPVQKLCEVAHTF